MEKLSNQSTIIVLDLAATLQMIRRFEDFPDAEYAADILKELRNELLPVV